LTSIWMNVLVLLIRGFFFMQVSNE